MSLIDFCEIAHYSTQREGWTGHTSSHPAVGSRRCLDPKRAGLEFFTGISVLKKTRPLVGLNSWRLS